MLRNIRIFAIITLLALTACASEVGKIPFSGIGPQETTLTLAGKKDIGFWTELDVKYTGDMLMNYEIVLSQNGAAVATVNCNPLDVNIKIKSLETSFNNRYSKSYTGKMRCSATVPETGNTSVKATLMAGTGLELKKADLILKQ